MFVGHFAVGLAGKRFAPSVSLGTLVLAAMLADLLWCVFWIAGIEPMEFRQGMGAANYFHASNIALSHSLLLDCVWGGLFAAVYFLRRRSPRGAWILFAAVVSHWVLDWIAHPPDLQLAPGAHAFFGLGLWTSIPATIMVEGGFWLAAVILYARAFRPNGRTGIVAFWTVVVLLTIAWYGNISGPPPRDPHSAPYASLILFSLAVAWAYWMNRLRAARE
ncbi:MAG TPA: hypothetical protein VMB03_12550 [Bryobacteraceae bacterium]|nr:hypothetical protein [Bryobacteraceae bacterium]